MSEHEIKKSLMNEGITPKPREAEQPLVIVSRAEWGAREPVGVVPPMTQRFNVITITFNTRSPQCHTSEECIRVVRGVQQTDIADGQPDIDYNFLIGGDGKAYEGRGWKHRVSFTRKDEPIKNPDQTFDIGLIGDYRGTSIEYELITNAMALVDYGVSKKYIWASHTFSN